MQVLSRPFTSTLLAGFVSLAAISIASNSLAVPIEQVPNPRQVAGGWVTDMAGVLSPSTETQLNRTISQLEAKNGMAVGKSARSNAMALNLTSSPRLAEPTNLLSQQVAAGASGS